MSYRGPKQCLSKDSGHMSSCATDKIDFTQSSIDSLSSYDETDYICEQLSKCASFVGGNGYANGYLVCILHFSINSNNKSVKLSCGIHISCLISHQLSSMKGRSDADNDPFIENFLFNNTKKVFPLRRVKRGRQLITDK